MHNKTPHVVIFPYDEHGHVTPAFALGRALAGRGIRVTGVLTATRYANGLTILPAAANSLFRIVTIPDSALQDDGSKEDDICYQHSLQKLEPELEKLMRRLQPPPSFLIYDIIMPWSQDLADSLGIPGFQISVFSAMALLLLFHTPALYAKGLLPFQPGTEDELLNFIPVLPSGFRLGDAPVDFLSRDQKQLDVLFNMLNGTKRAAGVLMNTVYELEAEIVEVLATPEVGLRGVYTLGSMSNLLKEEEAGCHGSSSTKINSTQSQTPAMDELNNDEISLIHWLDTQPRASVVYVALGSMIILTEEEIKEMAWGLEACGQPFVWVLRRHRRQGRHEGQQGVDDNDELEVASGLPSGFLQKNCERGRVVDWAPQAVVLAHGSVGCYITHCGLGSVFEAMAMGVPMIGGFCQISDQNTNLRLLTHDWGPVAIPLQDPHVSPPPPLRSCIVSRVKEVLHGDSGRALSSNASKIKAIMRQAVAAPHGSSYLNLAKLSHTILSFTPTC